ncbi:MAG TPA: serine hydrolase domain-containing protein, partial [Gemmatimonadales bacterium]
PATPPAPVPSLTTDWLPVIRYLDSAVAAGAAPGAVLGISHLGERFMHGTGQLGADEPERPGPTTVYDLASLTKVVGLMPVVMLAVQSGKLELDAPVQRYVPAFVGEGKEAVTVRMLLAHASGLPAWRPLYREAATRDAAFALADTTPLVSPPGTADLYSDLGIIVLTQALETVYGQRLDSILTRLVLSPLGMTSTAYLPPTSWRERIAPTELDPWRGRVLRGEVHDENAAVLGGVSGHAGLFSSADDLLTFAEWMLERMEGLREFTRRQDLVAGSSRALGWDTPTTGSSAGTRLSPGSFGHTGFTGTSLWIDPERRLAIVLLSNRINPTRENPRWAPVRAQIADLLMATLLKDAR